MKNVRFEFTDADYELVTRRRNNHADKRNQSET